MIDLTRFNNQRFCLNADLIKYVEQAPDTVITLVTGEKLVVRESAEEIIQKVVAFRRLLLAQLHEGPALARKAQVVTSADSENSGG
jgi:flagellar protein FlbD